MSLSITKLKIGTTDDAVVIMDGPTNRRMLRLSAAGISISTAHQESKENGKYPTQRTNLRFTETFPVSESSDSVDAYWQLSCSVPKTVVTKAQMAALLAKLVNLLIYGGNPSDEGYHAVSFESGIAAQLFAGEP